MTWAVMSPKSRFVQKRLLHHFLTDHDTFYVSRSPGYYRCVYTHPDGPTTKSVTLSCQALNQVLWRDEVTHVYVATPTNTHEPIVRACLKAGKHVFVEKTPSTYLHDIWDLRALAEKYKVSLQVSTQCYNFVTDFYNEVQDTLSTVFLDKARVTDEISIKIESKYYMNEPKTPIRDLAFYPLLMAVPFCTYRRGSKMYSRAHTQYHFEKYPEGLSFCFKSMDRTTIVPRINISFLGDVRVNSEYEYEQYLQYSVTEATSGKSIVKRYERPYAGNNIDYSQGIKEFEAGTYPDMLQYSEHIYRIAGSLP